MSLSYLPHSIRKLELHSMKDFKLLGRARTLQLRPCSGSLILSEGSIGDILQGLPGLFPEKVHLDITVDFWEEDGRWNDCHIDHLVINPRRREGTSVLHFTCMQEYLDDLMFISPHGRIYEIKAFTPPKENFRRG